MEVNQVLCMNGGDGETSYTHNSQIQKQAMIIAKPVLEEALKELCLANSLPKCLKIADFGCSSGPNTLAIVSRIIDIVEATCKNLNQRQKPMFQFFLNDLPSNDYNSIFRSLPRFFEDLREQRGAELGSCFMAAVPGSFYGRLFPNLSLHFVHSSYSLHWLSKVPEKLGSRSGAPLNKGNIYIAKTSPRAVLEAYLGQFELDFSLFLKCRVEEMVSGGHMVLTVVGRDEKVGRCTVWELLGNTLNDMVLEGVIEEEKLDSFNLPYYAPTLEQVRQIVESEGSLDIRRFETFEMDWDANNNNNNNNGESKKGENVATSIRAVAEPLLASHFGKNGTMDGLFHRFAEKITEFLRMERGRCTNIVIAMIKK